MNTHEPSDAAERHLTAGDRSQQAPSPAPPLVIRNLVKAYAPGKPVLNGLNISLNGDGLTAIIGPSGTGKSTLIRCINRLVEPTSGEILFMGRDLARLRGTALRHARRRIGMVFQEYNLVERLTVLENVLCGRLGYVSAWRAWLRRFSRTDIDAAFNLLEHVGLSEFALQRADALSGGQRQRVGIARAVMQDPGLLLADEPTSSLDPKTSVEIMELMAELGQRQSIPIIVNMHNVALASRFAERIIGLSQGTVIFDGPPTAITDEILKEIYGGQDWLIQNSPPQAP